MYLTTHANFILTAPLFLEISFFCDGTMDKLRTIDIEKRYEKHVEAYKTVSTYTFCLLNGYYFITLSVFTYLPRGKIENVREG